MLNDYTIVNTILNTLHKLTLLIFTIILRDKCRQCPYFADEDTKHSEAEELV